MGGQVVGQFLGVGLDVLLSLVLDVTDLLDLALELVDESEGVPLRILLLGAHRVGDVVVVVGHKPNPVLRPQLVPLPRMRSQCLNLLRDLTAGGATFSASEAMSLLEGSLSTEYMGMEVE